jgi:4-hydroxy-2-oxoheptanedioate aldolase
MNNLENDMIDKLKTLVEDYGVIAIKAEFEAEGSRIEEMMRLKDVTSAVNLPIILKIGGVEAITDIFNGLLIGVEGIIAPMAETAFAVSKFLGAIETFVPEDNRKDIHFGINIETITAVQNIHQMLQLPNINLLNTITVGRSDLVGSLGYSRERIDSNEILDLSRNTLRQARAKGFKTAIGGTITASSIDFLSELVAENLIDKYETRKVVFSADAITKNPHVGILKALEFELLWLKSKRRYYTRIKAEDEHRIEMLEKRLGQR